MGLVEIAQVPPPPLHYSARHLVLQFDPHRGGKPFVLHVLHPTKFVADIHL